MRITVHIRSQRFTPPGHFVMKAFVLQALRSSGHLTTVRSVFLPGGRAKYSVSSQIAKRNHLLLWTANSRLPQIRNGPSTCRRQHSFCPPAFRLSLYDQTEMSAGYNAHFSPRNRMNRPSHR